MGGHDAHPTRKFPVCGTGVNKPLMGQAVRPTPQENFLFVERASCPFLTGSPTHPTRKFPVCATGILPVLNGLFRPTPQENFLFVQRASCPFLTGSPTHPTRKFPVCATGILPVLNNNSSRTAANSRNYSRTNQMSQTQSFRNFTSVCQTLEQPSRLLLVVRRTLEKRKVQKRKFYQRGATILNGIPSLVNGGGLFQLQLNLVGGA